MVKPHADFRLTARRIPGRHRPVKRRSAGRRVAPQGGLLLAQVAPGQQPVVLLVQKCRREFIQVLSAGDSGDNFVMADGDEVIETLFEGPGGLHFKPQAWLASSCPAIVGTASRAW